MNRFWRAKRVVVMLLLAVLTLVGVVVAEEAAQPLPPIQAYLNIRQAYDAHFTADGQTVVFRTNVSGASQVWKVAAQGGDPVQLTAYEDSVDAVFASPTDANVVIFAKAAGGNERQQLFLLKLDDGKIERLTDLDTAIFNFGVFSRDGKQLAYASNQRDAQFFDVYVMDLASRATRLVCSLDAYLEAVAFSPSGERLVVSKWESNFNNDLYLVDLTAPGKPRLLTPHAGWATYELVRWPLGPTSGEGFYVVSNLGGPFAKLGFLDVKHRRLDYQDMGPWDTEALTFSRNGVVMAYANNVQGFSKVAVANLLKKEVLPAPRLAEGVLWGIEVSPRGDHLVLTYARADLPADIYLVEAATGKITRLTHSDTAGLDPQTFIPPTLMPVPTRDEKVVPTFVYLPKDLPWDQKVPCIMMLHGGPEGQARPAFSYLRQYFLSRGFAWVEPNVRGSSGFGKEFGHLDDVGKRLDSVSDMVDVVAFLRKHVPRIDADRVALYGGSYGGYMVLAGLTEHPDLFAAGVSVVGIANFETFLEKTGPWRRAIREAEYGSLEKDRELLRRISPIHKVDKIKAPLLVIHGKNDPRVPFFEAEQIVAALQKRNMPVELLAYDDEGHGLRKLTNKLDAYPKMAAFLQRHLAKKETAAP